MQQACGAGVEIARATGANTLTSSRINNNLAVKRCIGDFGNEQLKRLAVQG